MNKARSTINYGEIIKALRKKHKMTQTELGRLVSVGKTAISNYENDYSIPSATILENLAAVFGMTFAEFLTYDYEPITQNVILPKEEQMVVETTIPYIKKENVKLSRLEAKDFLDSVLVLPKFMTEDDGGYICVKMPDDSMEPDRICKNDYLIVKKSKIIKNKQIVLAISKATDAYVVRKYIREGHIASLIPSSASKNYAVMRIDERDEKFDIVGYVEKVIFSVK